jgi:hypothetical protein
MRALFSRNYLKAYSRKRAEESANHFNHPRALLGYVVPIL